MGTGESSRIIFHAIDEALGICGVVREQSPSRRTLTKRRYQKLGAVEVGGQLAFQLAVQPLVVRRGRARIAQILAETGMDWSDIPEDRVVDVASVNTPEAVEALAALKPDVVLVNGTRIIGKKTLAALGVPFVNTHSGITPRYRGVHGGYWALAEDHPEWCGVTVHLVDTGIDTGGVLAQAVIQPKPEDTFASYRFLQLAAAIPCLIRVLPEVAAGNAKPATPLAPTAPLYYHPTIWGYLRTWWMRGVR